MVRKEAIRPLEETPMPAQINQSLQHGLEVLMHLAASAEPLGSRELARITGREATHVNRLLGTLAHMGLAQRTENRKYLVGNGIHVLAALAIRGSKLFNRAHTHLTLLARRSGANVALGVLWGTQVCYLYFGRDSRTLEATIARRSLFPATNSSIGKVLLAAKTDRALAELYPEDPGLMKEIRSIRSQGYAVGLTGSVAVLVGSAVAGLALYEIPENEDRAVLLKLLRQTAEDIQAELEQ